MNTRIVCYVYGSVFLLVGAAGFSGNPLLSETGLFAVNAAHNWVHIVTGALFIGAAMLVPGRESRVLKTIGWVYAAVSLAGFLTSGDLMLDLIRINEADRWLHLGLAAAILASGYLFKDRKRTVSLLAAGLE
ncbi:MAG: DUF4383 domain-containing protein [Gammaproteobacteria bacterium]